MNTIPLNFLSQQQKNCCLKIMGSIFLIALMTLWQVILLQSKSMIELYCLVFILGLGGLYLTLKQSISLKQLIAPRQELFWPFIVCALLFSLTNGLANVSLLLKQPIFLSLFFLLGGLCVSLYAQGCALWILDWLKHQTNGKRKENKINPWIVGLSSFALLALIYFLFLYYALDPGYFTWDPMNQMEQVINNVYTNHHPYWHTLLLQLAMKISSWLQGDYQLAVSLYSIGQILSLSAAFGFLFKTLYQLIGRLGIVVLAVGITALLPFNIVMASWITKDVPYAIGMLILTCCFVRLLTHIGKNWINLIGIVFGALVIGLLRSNGFITLIGTTILLALFTWKKQTLLIVLLILVSGCTWLLRGPYLRNQGIKDASVAEMLNVPIQQITKVIAEEKELTAQEKKALEVYHPLEFYKENYISTLSDPIKSVFISDHDLEAVLRKNLPELLSIWISIGLRNPDLYLVAWSDLTSGYYDLGQIGKSYGPYVRENELGIVLQNRSLDAQNFLTTYNEVFWTTPFRCLQSLGLPVWILLFYLAYCISRKNNLWICLIPLLLQPVSLSLSTPVNNEMRYMYCVLVCMPLVLFLPFFKTSKQTGIPNS